MLTLLVGVQRGPEGGSIFKLAALVEIGVPVLLERICRLSWILPATLSMTAALDIGYAAPSITPTFCRDVAPILLKHCGNCHRPRGIASAVLLLEYDSARPWAKSIKQKVLTREMPPWSADPNTSLKFRNDARLNQREITTIAAWVDAGAAKGDQADLPPMPDFREGWQHPQGLKPDLVISLPGLVQVPANGEIPYVKLLAKVPTSEDKWIAAIQAIPGNAAVVHHMAITEVSLGGVSPSELGPLAAVLGRQLGFPDKLVQPLPVVRNPVNSVAFDTLGIYVPGTQFEEFPDESAKLLKGGQDLYLSFNIHYQAIGKPENDRSMLAFWFREGPPKHQLFRVPSAVDTILASGKELLTDSRETKAEGTSVAIPPIPPYAESYELIGMSAYTEPVTIYEFQPHGHLRARDFTYTVVYPDGKQVTALTVPRYDFRWQLAYQLETPLKLPAGSKLVVTAHYDNSRNNKYNPAPEKSVYFRDQNQSWDEMFTPFIEYSSDVEDAGTVRSPSPVQAERLPIVEVVGCLAPDAAGWALTRASDPVPSKTQSTTSAAVKAAGTTPPGSRQYQLIGASFFNPPNWIRKRVAVKGVLIDRSGQSLVNVTSLQAVADGCR